MRVLLLSWEFPPYVVGGMGKHVAELVPALSGFSVDGAPLQLDVVTQFEGDSLPREQIDRHTRIHRVELPSIYPIDLVNCVVDANRYLVDYASELLAAHDYDIIHIHDWLVAEAGITLKLRHRVPLITTVHATERGRHQGNLPGEMSIQIDHMEWRACFEAWEVIVCSRYMAQEVNYFFGTPMDKIDIIPNGVNLDHIPCYTEAERRQTRRTYAPNGERLLFFVGRMVFEKGLQLLLEAMPGILAKHPDTRLIVAGKNSQIMEEVARRFGVADRVDFLGYVSDEHRDLLYQSVDTAIFPSIYEPFGIVALEAMANDCHVIVSDVAGLSEVVHHEINGLTTLPQNPESIVWAVDRLFSDMRSGQQRKARARREVAALYNWDLVARKTTDVYKRVSAARGLTDW